jgi:hypothetical protein
VKRGFDVGSGPLTYIRVTVVGGWLLATVPFDTAKEWMGGFLVNTKKHGVLGSLTILKPYRLILVLTCRCCNIEVRQMLLIAAHAIW